MCKCKDGMKVIRKIGIGYVQVGLEISGCHFTFVSKVQNSSSKAAKLGVSGQQYCTGCRQLLDLLESRHHYLLHLSIWLMPSFHFQE